MLADNFSKTVSRAKDHGMRVFSLARRDFKGSTPFTETELEQIRGNDEDMHRQFLRDRGFEIAQFLVALIEKFKLPAVDRNGQGGLSIMGWSLGNMILYAFANYFSTYPKRVKDHLKSYLGSLICWGKRRACNSVFLLRLMVRRSVSLPHWIWQSRRVRQSVSIDRPQYSDSPSP